MDRLIEQIIKKRNPTVVGLDPRLSYVPDDLIRCAFADYGETLEGAAQAILSFNIGLIDVLCSYVPAIKCQSACYEMYGVPGMQTLEKTIQYAKMHGLYVILDGKRNDIGSTAECYSAAFLGAVSVGTQKIAPFNADCLTVNGYLGSDGIVPFLRTCCQEDKDLFALVKTSNPSSGELQNLLLENGRTVYERMAELINLWSCDTVGKYGYTRIGAVVGATWPEQLLELRRKFPKLFFLVPGYGSQGGGAEDVRGAFDHNGLGALVNNSRGIMCAYQHNGGDYQKAALEETIKMRDALRAVSGL